MNFVLHHTAAENEHRASPARQEGLFYKALYTKVTKKYCLKKLKYIFKFQNIFFYLVMKSAKNLVFWVNI